MSADRPSSLRETMEAMHALVRGELTPEAAAERLDAPAERLTVYQDFVRNHVDQALAKNYPTVAEIVTQEQWRALIDGYFRTEPPAETELNAAAAGFRGYLAARVEKASEESLGLEIASYGPALLELAELEWREFEVYATRIGPLPAGSPDTPIINPTLQILQLETPVASWLAARRVARRSESSEIPGDPLPTAGPGETVFLFREPTTNFSVFAVADDALLFAFKIAHDGLTPSQAAEQAGLPITDVEAVLRRAVALGLIL